MNLKYASVLATIAISVALFLLFQGKIEHSSGIFLAENKDIEEAFI